jgi:hypothetical protein
MEGGIAYSAFFAVLATVCLVLEWPAKLGGSKQLSVDRPVPPASFLAFRSNYLFVYSLMMGASACQALPVAQR